MLPFQIARRYFLSRRSQRVINIISMISMGGILVGTAALIVVLSVFNGFEDLILRLYNSFDPDIKISLVEGKSFERNEGKLMQLRQIPGVTGLTEVIEENALVKYRDKQYITTLKGVSDDFRKNSGVDSLLVDGEYILQRQDTSFALVGGGIAYNLQINLRDPFSFLEIYAPNRLASSLANPEEAFNERLLLPSGVFSIQQEFDNKYILVSKKFAEDIFSYEGRLTSVELITDPKADLDEVKNNVSRILGPDYVLKDRFEQHATIYKIMKSEKWAVFLILTFILVIATFNVISSLTMLVIDKKKDVAILQSMGATKQMVRKIFVYEGMIITVVGAIGGILLGSLVCLVQQEFGLIKLAGSGSFIIDAYPVKMLFTDFVYVSLTVMFIGLIAAWYPSHRLITDKLDMRAIAGDE